MAIEQPTLLTGLGAVLISVVSFVIGNNRNNSKARSGVYRRLDENKKEVEDTFVRQKVCDVQHKYTNDKLDGMDKKIDKLLLKNGIK